MEYVGIESIKNHYRDILQEREDYREAAQLEQKEFQDPVFDGYYMHAESEMDLREFNYALQRIGIDLLALDNQFISSANLYDQMMDDVLDKLAAVDEIISAEEERIQDLNIITGNFNGFSGIKSFGASDLSGTCSAWDDNTFTTQATTRYNIPFTVLDISGNGYEGNKYVYSDSRFSQEYIDTSNRNNINDQSSTSYYEYSRITMTNKPSYYPADINFDNKEAECTIVIQGNEQFNTVKVQSDFDTLEVTQVAVSSDGVDYLNTMLEPIQINNTTLRYDKNDYIYGSGVLVFPNCKYAKISLKSNNSLRENLAFERVMLDYVYTSPNLIFNVNSFITEYLAPLIIETRFSDDSYFYIRPSIVIAVILARTRSRASNIGLYNFFMLPFDSDISDQYADNNKCAFDNRNNGAQAIFNLLLSEDYQEVVAPILQNTVYTNDLKNCIRDILNIISKNADDDYNNAVWYFDEYNLTDYDNIDKLDLLDNNIVKYEQYFKRYDEQNTLFSETIDEAKSIVQLDGAVRHVIRINDITAFSNTHETSSYIKTPELITNPVDCIAVFANEYVPPTFPSQVITSGKPYYFNYYFEINGKEYEVVPVNCHRQGTKIIRYSDHSIADNYTKHISEPIKSAVLVITLTTYDNSYSPYLSNLKVCLGKVVV